MKLTKIIAMRRKIIVFGAGQSCDDFMSVSALPVSYYIDNDINKQNTIFYGAQVYSPSVLLKERESGILIIVMSIYYAEIKMQLEVMGFIEQKDFINGLLIESPYEKITPHATYGLWNEDEQFLSMYNCVKESTLVDKYRCYELWSLVEQVGNLEGELIEIGVWRGGTGALIAKKSSLLGNNDTVYLCDTFKGVVKVSDKDSIYVNGMHNDTTIDYVRSLLNNFHLNNYKLLEGIFPDDTSSKVDTEKFKFCHIDVDVYRSAKDIVEWIWDRMVIGGVVVFDDFGFRACDGITKYVNEIKGRNDLIFIHNLNGHAVLIKIK